MLLRVVTWKQQNIRSDVEMLLSYLENSVYTIEPISYSWITETYDLENNKISEEKYLPSLIFEGIRYWVAKDRARIFR